VVFSKCGQWVGSEPGSSPILLTISNVAGLDNRSSKASMLVASGMAPAWHQPQKERLTVKVFGEELIRNQRADISSNHHSS
jgi:hypothetical protein